MTSLALIQTNRASTNAQQNARNEAVSFVNELGASICNESPIIDKKERQLC